jgi:hypothetical protein
MEPAGGKTNMKFTSHAGWESLVEFLSLAIYHGNKHTANENFHLETRRPFEYSEAAFEGRVLEEFVIV